MKLNSKWSDTCSMELYLNSILANVFCINIQYVIPLFSGQTNLLLSMPAQTICRNVLNAYMWDGHKPGKHEKPGERRQFDKLSKSQVKNLGKFEFLYKNLENSGKI